MVFRLAFPRPGLASLVAFLLLPALASAQQEVQGRFRVMIPDLFPGEETSRGFGEDVAEELRDLINQLPTHEPVERGEIRDALRDFDIDRDDLNCIRARQLATQINSELVMCGYYTEGSDDWTLSAEFVSVASGETFSVEEFTVPDDDGDELAAQHIFAVFDGYIEQLRFAAICQEYFGSQQWANALQNCDQALEGNPSSESSRYARARSVMELGERREGLDEFLRVLDLNPFHEGALQYAGMLSAEFGMDEESLAHYSAYLELNPGNAAVRMNVAYELATAGNPRGAMTLIQEGLAMDDTNINLWEQLGGFAFTAAGMAMEGQSELTPEVRELYRTAIEAYTRVFDDRGAETGPPQLSNVIAAYVQLQDLPGAIAFAGRAVEAHPQEASLWSRLADALQRNGQLDEAITALQSAKEADPEYPNLSARQGSWLLEEGDVDGAIGFLREAVERGEQSADAMANQVFNKAYGDGVQAENWTYAISILERAKSEFEVSERYVSQLHFWHGYSLYNHGLAVQEANTLDSARQSLPIFQEALRLFEAGRAYANTMDSINLQQFLEATGTYVDIQDAIIRRGGGE